MGSIALVSKPGVTCLNASEARVTFSSTASMQAWLAVYTPVFKNGSESGLCLVSDLYSNKQISFLIRVKKNVSNSVERIDTLLQKEGICCQRFE